MSPRCLQSPISYLMSQPNHFENLAASPRSPSVEEKCMVLPGCHLSTRNLKTPPLLLLRQSRFSRVRLCDPIDGSPPGSPIPGILQARVLEWVAIAFSNA